jgi:hypothetical protein
MYVHTSIGATGATGAQGATGDVGDTGGAGNYKIPYFHFQPLHVSLYCQYSSILRSLSI